MVDHPKLPSMATMLAQAAEIERQALDEDRAGLHELETEVTRAVRNAEVSPQNRAVSAREMDRLVETVNRYKLTTRDLADVHGRLAGVAGLTPPEQRAAKSAVAFLHNMLLKTERLARENQARCTLVAGEERAQKRSPLSPATGEIEAVAVCKGPKGTEQENKDWLRAAARTLADPRLGDDEIPEK